MYKASLVTMMGGADFIKTSTGKEKINATMAVSLVMIRAIRDYYEETGFKVCHRVGWLGWVVGGCVIDSEFFPLPDC